MADVPDITADTLHSRSKLANPSRNVSKALSLFCRFKTMMIIRFANVPKVPTIKVMKQRMRQMIWPSEAVSSSPSLVINLPRIGHKMHSLLFSSEQSIRSSGKSMIWQAAKGSVVIVWFIRFSIFFWFVIIDCLNQYWAFISSDIDSVLKVAL